MADRDDKRGRLKRAVARTAPELARTLGGPLAGAAVEAIARAVLGGKADDEDAVAAAVETMSPDQAAALARAEQEFRLALRAAAIEERRVDNADRADARARQTALKDATPSILGGLIIAGFFLVLAAMIASKLPPGAETEFSIMLGALATMTAAVVNYFFGSSAGSREKTLLIARGSAEKNAHDAA